MSYPTMRYQTVLARLDGALEDTRRGLVRTVAALLDGGASAMVVFEAHAKVVDAIEAIDAAKAVHDARPDFATYVNAQKPGGVADLAATLATVRAACVSARTTIRATVPTGGPGGAYLLAWTWGTRGPTPRTFTAGEAAGVVTALEAVLTTIE